MPFQFPQNAQSASSKLPATPIADDFPPGRERRVLIVGGSTRAAASSARRAGLQPICADLFADHDTRQIAEVIPVRSFPESLPDDVAHVQADGWFYTGALENRPDLIERMDHAGASYGPLWGTRSAVLKQIRDPFWIANTLRQSGHCVLEVKTQAAEPPADGTWMLKPLSSAGGRAVSVWNESRRSQGINEPVYFQRLCHGDVMSAVFRCDPTGISLLGMSRQLPGHVLSEAAAPFLYGGSLGPLPCEQPTDHDFALGERVTSQLQSLANGCHLRGIIGVDFISDENGIPWMLEVNPRYTASVEILELSSQQSFVEKPGDESRLRSSNERPVVMKLIVYAPRSVVIGDLTQLASIDVWKIPGIADIPVPGSQIQAGWPICTVFSHGTTEEECVARLKRRVDTVWKMVNYRGDEPVERFQE